MQRDRQSSFQINMDLRHADYFLFTQHSLATFENCPLKFRKRYIESLKWNTLPDEKIKRRLEAGNDFHLLAQRYFLGIDPGLTASEDGAAGLESWVENLKRHFPKKQGFRYLPEYKLRMASGNLKLEANFDLLVAGDASVEIWDWKTHGKRNKKGRAPEGGVYADSLQTVVYMFVLKEQISLVTGKELECGKISMNYWQPDPPQLLAEIRYTAEMHEDFRRILENKITSILDYDYTAFDKSLYEKHCRLCEFNWFCNNERVDFAAIEEEDDLMDELDWESIEEKY